MKVPPLRHNELYLLGLLFSRCEDHIASVFDLKELVTTSFSIADVRQSANNLGGLGLVSVNTMATSGQRRGSDMLMLTTVGFNYCLSHEALVLNAMLSGGSITEAQAVRDAFNRLRIDGPDDQNQSAFEWTDVQPPLDDHSPISAIASADWTGIEHRIAADPQILETIKRHIHTIDEIVDRAGLTNAERAKAKAISQALVHLVESPEPEWKAIVHLLTAPALVAVLNVAQIAGIIFAIFGFGK